MTASEAIERARAIAVAGLGHGCYATHAMPAFLDLSAAALALADWLNMNRADGAFWCDEEYATDRRTEDGRQVYDFCSHEAQCGDCVRLNALVEALAAVTEALDAALATQDGDAQ